MSDRPKRWAAVLILLVAMVAYMQFGDDEWRDSLVEELNDLADRIEEGVFEDDGEPDQPEEEEGGFMHDTVLAALDPVIRGNEYAEPTSVRAARYLEENEGDIGLAVQAAVDRHKSLSHKLKTLAIGSIPLVGMPASLARQLWRQLRLVSVIAAMNEADMEDPEIQNQLLLCLVEADMAKMSKRVFATLSKDMIAKRVGKRIASKTVSKGAKFIVKALPIGGIFDVLTDDTAKIGSVAAMHFGGQDVVVTDSGDVMGYAMYCVIAMAAGKYLEKQKVVVFGVVGLVAILVLHLLDVFG